MMRLPNATSVNTWQTSRAVRGEVVFNSFRIRVIACQLSCGMKWRQWKVASSGQWARLIN